MSSYHVAASLRDDVRVSERLAYVNSGKFSSADRLITSNGFAQVEENDRDL